MPQINKYQMFSLILLFEIGSTTLFALGIDAKKDAWLAVLISIPAAIVLMWIYTELQRSFPDKNLVQIIELLIGKWLGIPLSILFGLYFIYISIQNISEFVFIAQMVFLKQTPLIILIIFFMIIVIYALISGLEVISRVSVIMAPILVAFLFAAYIAVAFSIKMNFDKMKPVLEHGFIPVLKAAYPHILAFPFGEMIVFSMYWKYLNEKKLFRKVTFLAVFLSGILLTISLIMIVSVLGANVAAERSIPLLSLFKRIRISFITNIDVIVVIILTIGGFYKMAIFFYGGILALSSVFKMKTPTYLVIGAGIATMILTYYILPSIHYHRWIGFKVNTNIIHPIFSYYIPPLLFIVFLLKKSNFPDKLRSTA